MSGLSFEQLKVLRLVMILLVLYWHEHLFLRTAIIKPQSVIIKPRSVIKKPQFCVIRHICQRFFIIQGLSFQRFLRDKNTIPKYFWVFYNDSLGINYVNSYYGCLQFWRKSWPIGETCDFRNVTSVMDSIEKIFQVLNEGGRSFEQFMKLIIQTKCVKGTK